MNHNLENRTIYPNHHIFLSSTNIMLYTQGIPVKAGDTLKYRNKTYIVDKAIEYKVLEQTRSADTEENWAERREYLTKKTRFFSIKYTGEIPFEFTIDRYKSNNSIYNVPKYSKGNKYSL